MLKTFRKTAAQILIAGIAFTGAAMAQAQSVNGVWNMHDGSSASDAVTGQIRLEEKGGLVTGTMVKYTDPAKANEKCDECPDGDARKGKPTIGMVVLSGLKSAGGGKYEDGLSLRPAKGDSLKTTAELKEGGKQLEMKFKVGFLSVTRMWTKAN